jgi:2-hydroxy-3-keto-5-methylthiopentenyl-1-phosphate phosphatase
MDKVFKIFVDFDGTISCKDVGAAIFEEFGDHEKVEKIQKDLHENKITALQCWVSLFEAVEKWDFDLLRKFIDTINIDESFADFIKYCKLNNFQLFILSDGFNLYINRILEKEGIEPVEVISNKWEIVDDKVKLTYPFMDEECKDCANCKRNHIINNSGDDEYTVYIGDGTSDRCPAQYCDFIFAKDFLLKYCEKERISFSPFRDFNDVSRKIDQLNQKKNLKKRHQADLKRKECYMRG